jgi:hypothetical protein
MLIMLRESFYSLCPQWSKRWISIIDVLVSDYIYRWDRVEGYRRSSVSVSAALSNSRWSMRHIVCPITHAELLERPRDYVPRPINLIYLSNQMAKSSSFEHLDLLDCQLLAS